MAMRYVVARADEFDVLPLHFDNRTLEYIDKDIGWDRILPDYAMYPERFQVEVIPKLVASLIYHRASGDLNRLYPKNHPIFFQTIFTDSNIYERIKKNASHF